MFKIGKETEDLRNFEGIYEEMLDGAEAYLMKVLGMAVGSTGSFPGELDQETVAVINDALAYWKTSKKQMLQMAKIADERHESLVHELDEIQKFMDQQATLLRGQERTLEEISKKLDKQSSKTKAE